MLVGGPTALEYSKAKESDALPPQKHYPKYLTDLRKTKVL
jgi:hypothetical protein